MPITKEPADQAFAVRHRVPRGRGLALAACLLGCSCGAMYQDQVEVPGTDQRLVVGSDSWPTSRVWVVVAGKQEPVKIVREAK